ncbi:MAG: SO_0444 family Cu/Zn efflux transporter [Thermodesulfobacteriota bacterium]
MESQTASLPYIFWEYLLNTFLILAPVFLFGLFLSGLMRVLISRDQVLSLMGKNDLKSSIMAALAGVPIPLCSCSVLPVVTELRKKGASKPACASFLVTAPETGVDSIPITYALLGPFMAVYRPVASLFSAIFTSILIIGLDDEKHTPPPQETEDECGSCGHHSPEHGHDHHGHDHEYGDDDFVGVSGLYRSVRFALASSFANTMRALSSWDWFRPVLGKQSAREFSSPRPEGLVPAGRVFRAVSRHAFIEQMDELLYPLIVGILIGGVIVVAIPADISSYGISGPVSYFLLLLAGIPVYICASAATPIAAALILKGISPGAALVFLLSGPATNTPTVVVLGKQFGWRFSSIYVSSIAFTSLVTGVVLDIVLLKTGFNILASTGGLAGGLVGAVQIAGLAAFVALAVWRVRKNPTILPEWTGGLRFSVPEYSKIAALTQRAVSSKTTPYAAAVLAVVWLATGFFTVTPGSVGYGKLFNKVVSKDLAPGLHWAAPYPFGASEVYRSEKVRRLVLGIVELNKIPLQNAAAPAASTPAAANVAADYSQEFITGDGSLLRAALVVHYRVKDPFTFFYGVNKPEFLIADIVKSSLRDCVAYRHVNDVLTTERESLELCVKGSYATIDGILNPLSAGGDDTKRDTEMVYPRRRQDDGVESSIGAEILSVNLVQAVPPDFVRMAYYDVSSANEDKERMIVDAQKSYIVLIPTAYGNARIELERGISKAHGKRLVAFAKADAFVARADAVALAPDVLKHLLWIETGERALSGREKFILPPGTRKENLNLWRASVAGKGEEKVEQHSEDGKNGEDRKEDEDE